MKTILTQFLDYLRKYALILAFIQALVATLGSLYYSEILGLIPCLLCWWQRIIMYPSALILFIAALRNDKNIAIYILPLSLIGGLIALYHYLLQITPLSNFNPISCGAWQECSKIDKVYFGFITIPFLSLIAFTNISLLMFILLKRK